MSYSNYDKLPKNSEEVYRLYADQEMGKTKNVKISTTGENTEIMYTKTYTGGERVARFFQGIGLAVSTLGIGIFVDRRIWNKFVATSGEVEKKVLIPNSLFGQVVQGGKVVVPERPSKDRVYEYAFAAEKKLNEGKPQEAITMLSSIIKENPDNAFVPGLLGEAYRQLATADIPSSNASRSTNLRLAKVYLEKSIQLEPRNAFAYARLGAVERQHMLDNVPGSDIYRNYATSAKEKIETALALNPDDPFATAELRLLDPEKMNLFIASLESKASEHMGKGEPRQASQVMLEQGKLELLSGSPKKAIVTLEAAFDQDPKNFNAAMELHNIYSKQNNIFKATQILLRVAVNLPKSVEELSDVEQRNGLSETNTEWKQFLLNITKNANCSDSAKAKAFAILGKNCLQSESKEIQAEGRKYLAEAVARQDTGHREIQSKVVSFAVSHSNSAVPISELFSDAHQIRQKLGLGKWKEEPKVEKVTERKQESKKNDIVCQYSQGEIGKIREFLTSGPVSDYVDDKDIEKKIAQLGTFERDQVGEDDMAQVIEQLGTDLDSTQAAVACSVICLKVVESFFTSGIPKSEREMYQLISDGVDTYTTDYADEGLLDFGEVFTHSLREDVNSQIVNVIPALPYKMAEEYMQYLELGDIPTQVVSTHLDVLLEALQNTANETVGKTCAVLTTESTHATNATFVIMFDENKKPVLFNSHGETYDGKEQGASLLRFTDMEALTQYVRNTFFKNEDGQFQLKILSTLS